MHEALMVSYIGTVVVVNVVVGGVFVAKMMTAQEFSFYRPL
jgi:hypothetical protein